jgi:transcriptional regulator with XRE-family HTH domain
MAWLLIKYRMDRGLSQEKLAELVGTSHSQISRIESGRHRTNLDTLSRIAQALGLRMVLGFESTTLSSPSSHRATETRGRRNDVRARRRGSGSKTVGCSRMPGTPVGDGTSMAQDNGKRGFAAGTCG